MILHNQFEEDKLFIFKLVMVGAATGTCISCFAVGLMFVSSPALGVGKARPSHLRGFGVNEVGHGLQTPWGRSQHWSNASQSSATHSAYSLHTFRARKNYSTLLRVSPTMTFQFQSFRSMVVGFLAFGFACGFSGFGLLF